jgi:hypothetical protein
MHFSHLLMKVAKHLLTKRESLEDQCLQKNLMGKILVRLSCTFKHHAEKCCPQVLMIFYIMYLAHFWRRCTVQNSIYDIACRGKGNTFVEYLLSGATLVSLKISLLGILINLYVLCTSICTYIYCIVYTLSCKERRTRAGNPSRMRKNAFTACTTGKMHSLPAQQGKCIHCRHNRENVFTACTTGKMHSLPAQQEKCIHCLHNRENAFTACTTGKMHSLHAQQGKRHNRKHSSIKHGYRHRRRIEENHPPGLFV